MSVVRSVRRVSWASTDPRLFLGRDGRVEQAEGGRSETVSRDGTQSLHAVESLMDTDDSATDEEGSIPGLTPVRSISDGDSTNAGEEESLPSRASPEVPSVGYSRRTDYVIMTVLEDHEVNPLVNETVFEQWSLLTRRQVFFKISLFVERLGRGPDHPTVLVQMLDTIPLGSDRMRVVRASVAMELQQGLVRALRLAAETSYSQTGN